MKYLDVWLRQPDWMCHPMQEFIRHEDVVRYEELLAWTIHDAAGMEYELFYVEADRERYRRAIDDVASVRAYSIAPIDEESFHLFVCQETRPQEAGWRGAFANRELVVVPPVRFDERGTMGLTLVGDGEDIQRMLAGLPDEIDVRVDEIGTYDRRGGSLAGSLTDRQREAVDVALEVGYYDVPREADLSTVADALGVAESTASILLRRGERAVFSRLLRRRGRSP